MEVGLRGAGPLTALLVAVLAGCGVDDTVALPTGMGCVDDSKHCIDQRSGALKALMADNSRKWVKEPPTAAAYASGVRLFAFKQKKRDLSCEELGIARREADAAATTLRGPSGKDLTPAQISRGVMFGGEVAKELANEQKRRCKV